MYNFTEEESSILLDVVNNPHTRFNPTVALRKHHFELWIKLLDATSFLPASSTSTERIYCVLNNLDSQPLCSFCHKNPVKFSRSVGEYGGYKKFCSISCGAKATSDQAKATKMERYGSLTNVEKTKETRYRKYGQYAPIDFAEKVKESKLLRYGDENFVNSEKMKQTKLEKYGDSGFNNHDKACKTKLEKYGAENFNNSVKANETKSNFSSVKKNEIQTKREETNIKKYGCANPIQNSEILQKIKETNIRKYGVDSILKLPETHIKSNEQLRLKSYNLMLSMVDEYEPLFSKDDFLKADFNIPFKWKHKKCGEVVFGRYNNGKIFAHCRKCYPYSSSKMEKDVLDYVKHLVDGDGINVIENTRDIISPLELDIYIPEKKTAIEFDGLYWHSEANCQDKLFHLKKTELCESLGINLIHIFEDEWMMKNEIVKSRLMNLLGKSSNRIYARQCEVKEVDYSTAESFLNENHIQGNSISKIRVGLVNPLNNELISLMTFGKSRFNKDVEWELIRFCNKCGYSIPGAASKLLAYFEKTYKPESIISYADRRWSNGNLYEKVGFKLDHISKPDYWYVKNDIRENRVKFQKHKLSSLLGENFNPSLSEVENMVNAGYSRIFDCGNLAFIKKY